VTPICSKAFNINHVEDVHRKEDDIGQNNGPRTHGNQLVNFLDKCETLPHQEGDSETRLQHVGKINISQANTQNLFCDISD